ncbi:hypothetical protein EYF80_059200 [Liparis tanakae]|uniref:Uncharacterized protein n=1 Tax=Liparis tanakae TaxID=230148 RepID=A0A4Z2ENX8_9TELE|nr:hypothetical protein EYF80_059200 [Liparis tanakae]
MAIELSSYGSPLGPSTPPRCATPSQPPADTRQPSVPDTFLVAELCCRVVDVAVDALTFPSASPWKPSWTA